MNIETNASVVSTAVTETSNTLAFGKDLKLEDVVLNTAKPEGKPEMVGNFVPSHKTEKGQVVEDAVVFTLKGEFVFQFKLGSDGSVYCSAIKNRLFEADIAGFSEAARRSKHLLLQHFVPKQAAVAASCSRTAKAVGTSIADKITALKQAKADGVLTDEEFKVEYRKLVTF